MRTNIKKILFISLVLIVANPVLALVNEGQKCSLMISRNKAGQLIYTLKYFDKKERIFKDINKVAAFCYKISGLNEKISNSLNIETTVKMSREDMQYIGDRCVENYVYPMKITFKNSKGIKESFTYKPNENYGKERKLK